MVVTHYTQPPAGSTTVCTDELGPVIPRTFAPAPGWSSNGHRIKALLEYSRGLEKVWIYGALRVCDGKEITRCASSCNSKHYIELLKDIEADNPKGDIFIITDNLSSHNSLETRTWLADHPRIQHIFIPKGARLCSISRRVGGVSSVVMLSPGRASPMLMKSSERCRWRRLNSIGEPNHGFGDDHPKRDAICIGSFLTAFEERSTTGTLLEREFPHSESQQVVRVGSAEELTTPSHHDRSFPESTKYRYSGVHND